MPPTRRAPEALCFWVVRPYGNLVNKKISRTPGGFLSSWVHHHSSSLSFKVHFSHSVGWTVHFLDGFPPCCPVSWVNVGNVRRSSVFFDCFLPCLVGSPTWFPPRNWEILYSLEPVGLFSPSRKSIPSQSALPHHLPYPYQAH